MADVNIYRRVHAVMQEVKGVEKTGKNTHANYTFAGHEAVTAALRGAYERHGIVRSASVVAHEWGERSRLTLTVEVRFTNIENPDDHIIETMVAVAPAQTKAGSATPQQAGVALSYAVKNAEFKLFALTGDPDPDADQYHEGQAPQQGSNGSASVDVGALSAGLKMASNPKELASAIAEVRKVSNSLSAGDLKMLNDERAAAKARTS